MLACINFTFVFTFNLPYLAVIENTALGYLVAASLRIKQK